MTYKIAVIHGDGVGPDIIKEGLKVLNTLQECADMDFEFIDVPAGAGCYLDTGSPLPKESLDLCKEIKTIYKGPVGGPIIRDGKKIKIPKGAVEQGMILTLRQALDMYVNLRPIKLYESLRDGSPLKERILDGGIDYIIVRENSEEFYSKVGGFKGKMNTEDKELDAALEKVAKLTGAAAIDVGVNTPKGVGRICRYAFNLAKKKGKKSVTLVDKSNVLFGSQYWTVVFDSVAKKFPNIKTERFYIDNFSQLILDPYVSNIEIAVMSNLFGDIVSDEGAKTIGSLGMGASVNLNPENNYVLAEPIHGTAPDIAGKGIANPIGTILSAAYMIEYAFNAKKEASLIEKAVKLTLKKGFRTKDIASPGERVCSTQDMGNAIVSNLKYIVETPKCPEFFDSYK